MDKLNLVTRKTTRTNEPTKSVEIPVIFGLRYLEEEATEIHDVVGCLRSIGTCTECDDED